MASGMPSRWRQISTTVGTLRVVDRERVASRPRRAPRTSRTAAVRRDVDVVGLRIGKRRETALGAPARRRARAAPRLVDEHVHVGRRREDRLDQIRGGVEHVLAVVQHDEHAAIGQVVQRARRGRSRGRRIAAATALDDFVAVATGASSTNQQPSGNARPRRPRRRARAASCPRRRRRSASPAARGRRASSSARTSSLRPISSVSAPSAGSSGTASTDRSGGNDAFADLEQLLRRAEVARAGARRGSAPGRVAPATSTVACEHTICPPCATAIKPRGPVHRRAEVVAVALLGLARVHPIRTSGGPMPSHRSADKHPLRFERGVDRVVGGVERGVEPVAGRLHDVPAVRFDGARSRSRRGGPARRSSPRDAPPTGASNPRCR